MNIKRREVIQALLAGSAFSVLGGAAQAQPKASSAKVVVIGGGFGGATAARYLRRFSGNAIEVTLVEQNDTFISCPLSNLVIGGERKLPDITISYDALANHGVKLVQDRASAIDVQKKIVKLAGGADLRYDKLVLSPGIELMFEKVEGLQQAQGAGQILQAWKAGEETVALARQLAEMRDGGVFALAIPEAPYRCPPGPYERASLVAAYLKKHKPKSKVLILDANMDVTSKGPLFKKAWADLYPGMIEYRGQHKAIAVDAKTMTVKMDFQDAVKADVLNVLPPMRAGALAVQTGLANANDRWCHVHFRNFESTAAKDVHVLGDSIQVASQMPKSGHMANSQAKVAAAAIVAELEGIEVNPDPVLNNTCYSFVSGEQAMHVASVHQYVASDKTFIPIQGAGGVSKERSAQEADYANAWARNIWADMLG